jgi:hypothetical protein
MQIPAFLCRQTDLLVACGKTGKPVNIKKGQFVSPDEMKNAVGKMRAVGNEKVLLTERGTFFVYNRLVNDMTSIHAMQGLGCPVVFDATHSTQRPGGLGNASAGSPELAPILAKAAVAAGANAVFMEIHPEPAKALCDAASMLPLKEVTGLVKTCKRIFEIVNGGKNGKQSSYKYLFGPVPSRRLGRSLGVDLLPLKTCTQNCIYCQLGKDSPQVLERKEYVPIGIFWKSLDAKSKTGWRRILLPSAGRASRRCTRGLESWWMKSIS